MSARAAVAVLGAAAALAVPASAHAKQGDPDQGFGVGGRTAAFSSPNPVSLLPGPDGGSLTIGATTEDDVSQTIIAHTATGLRRTDFGQDGVVKLPLKDADASSGARSAAVDGDGHLYVAGAFEVGGSRLEVRRLSALSGAVDAGYGMATVALSPGSKPELRGIALFPDGSVVLTAASDTTAFVARITPNGEPDTTFGFGGVRTYSLSSTPGQLAYVHAPTALPDGRVRVLAALSGPDHKSARAAVLGLTATGAPDPDFGVDGTAATALTASTAAALFATPAVLAPGGQLVIPIRGATKDAPPCVARLTAIGDLDGTFGTAGLACLTSATPGATMALAVQPSGRVLLTSFTDGSTVTAGRLTAAGAPDASFGSAGVVSLAAYYAPSIRFDAATGRAIVGDVELDSATSSYVGRLLGRVANVPPTVTAAPGAGTAGQPVVLHATAADVDGGQVTAIAWDTDGDGAFDDATGPDPTVTFDQPGARTVRVRATDDDGTSTSADAMIQVAPAAPPATTNTAPTPSTTVPVTLPPATTTTTAATPPVAPPLVNPVQARVFAVVSTRLVLDRRGRVAVRVLCSGAGQACAGRLTLRLGSARIGGRTFTAPAGRTTTVQITIRASARRRALQAKAKLTLRLTPAGGVASARRVTLRRGRTSR